MADDTEKVTGVTYVDKPAKTQDHYWLSCMAIRQKKQAII
jgi:hypothetical protein